MSIERWNEKASLIWSVADLLRGPYRPNQYRDVMLPMLVLRRLDCVLAPTRDAIPIAAGEEGGGQGWQEAVAALETPMPLEAIEAEIRDVEREIAELLAEMT